MGKILVELKARIIGSPTSTLGGALVGAFNLIMHMAATNVDWTQTKQMVLTALGTVGPVVVGALLKAVPKGNTVAQELAQKISQATIAAAEQAAASYIDKAIAEIQKLGGVSQVPAPQEEAKT